MTRPTAQATRHAAYAAAQTAALQALDALRAQIVAHGSSSEDQSFPSYGHIGFLGETTQKITDVAAWFHGE